MNGFTDLKKTMAVLLESMLERLSRLEVQVHQVINMSNSSIVNLTRPQMADQIDDSLHAEGTEDINIVTSFLSHLSYILVYSVLKNRLYINTFSNVILYYGYTTYFPKPKKKIYDVWWIFDVSLYKCFIFEFVILRILALYGGKKCLEGIVFACRKKKHGMQTFHSKLQTLLNNRWPELICMCSFIANVFEQCCFDFAFLTFRRVNNAWFCLIRLL
jgi:hypothetical protein